MVIKYLMEFFKITWGCSVVGVKSVGLPLKSLRFTFNGAVTGCSFRGLKKKCWALFHGK